MRRISAVIFFTNKANQSSGSRSPEAATGSVKKGARKSFANFTGKHLKACNFIKKRHRCFPAKFKKIFKSTNFEEHLRTAASGSLHHDDFDVDKDKVRKFGSSIFYP